MNPATITLWHADQVMADACTRAPRHAFREFRAGDVFAFAIEPEERIWFCTSCFVLRCGQSVRLFPSCALAVNHPAPHRDSQGRRLDPWPETTRFNAPTEPQARR